MGFNPRYVDVKLGNWDADAKIITDCKSSNFAKVRFQVQCKRAQPSW